MTFTRQQREKLTHLSIGICEVCREGHSLLDGVCWDCRKAITAPAKASGEGEI